MNYYFQVPQSSLDLDGVRSILAEYCIHNADITLHCDATADKIDQISIEVSCCRDCQLSVTCFIGYFYGNRS